MSALSAQSTGQVSCAGDNRTVNGQGDVAVLPNAGDNPRGTSIGTGRCCPHRARRPDCVTRQARGNSLREGGAGDLQRRRLAADERSARHLHGLLRRDCHVGLKTWQGAPGNGDTGDARRNLDEIAIRSRVLNGPAQTAAGLARSIVRGLCHRVDSSRRAIAAERQDSHRAECRGGEKPGGGNRHAARPS